MNFESITQTRSFTCGRSRRRWLRGAFAGAVAVVLATAGLATLAGGVPIPAISAQSTAQPVVISAEAWQGMMGSIERDRYEIRRSESLPSTGYVATNPAQRMTVRFAVDGAHLSPWDAAAGWEWNLRLAAIGTPGHLEPIEQDDALIDLESGRIEYNHRGVVEWYVNDRRGLEQGFTVVEPPSIEDGPGSSQRIVLGVATGGTLTPVAASHGRALDLVDGAGTTVLRYGGLVAWDAEGRDLPAHMTATGATIRIEVDATDAVYPLVIDPVTQVTKLQASNAGADDRFGRAVAISGDTVIVGAVFEDSVGTNEGAAYIFDRNAGGPDNWGEVAKIHGLPQQDPDFFGASVAISGDTALVGAPGRTVNANANVGAAYLFERNLGGADNWGLVKKLDGVLQGPGTRWGEDVAISGDTAVLGAWGYPTTNDAKGAIQIFERNAGGAGNWGSTKLIQHPSLGDWYGRYVAIDGDTIAVGAPKWHNQSLDEMGAVYVHQRDWGGAGNWGEVRRVQGSDTAESDFFGTVAISGDTIVAGASGNDTGGANAGAAYIFERNEGGANNWGQTQRLQSSDQQVGDSLGSSVAISGGIAIVGAQNEDTGGLSAGAAYAFGRNVGGQGNWGEVGKLLASDAETDDQFGVASAISGETAIVGARFEDTGGAQAGAAYIFSVMAVVEPPPNTPPVADAGEPITLECASPSGTAVTLNGLLSSDPDGDPLTFTWVGPFPEGGGTVTGGMPTVTLTEGTHTITLTVMDLAGVMDSDQVQVTVQDTTDPTMSGVPAPVTIPATGPGGAAYTVPLPTASDTCDPAPSIASDAPAVFPIGTTTVTFIASDAAGNQATATTTVTVFDTPGPTIGAVSASPNSLWPPNHKMRAVQVTIDASGSDPACQIVAVTSNEPVTGKGDGNTAPDWQITGSDTLQLRAERSGKGSGRTYTIQVECTDSSGKVASASTVVTVPKSKGR